MKKQPLVSIIIPFYNLGEYLEEAVQSCINQTHKNLEIIIVDDGSTEKKSIKILSDIEKNFTDKIKVLRQKNQGLPKSRNNGISIAKGNYICCLDADDKIDINYIEKTLKQLISNDNIGFVTTYALFFGTEELVWKTSDYNPIKLMVDNVVHVASLFKKKVWKEVNGYSKIQHIGYEDWDFWIKIVAKGYKWNLIPEPLFLYRRRLNSMVSRSDSFRKELLKDIIDNNINYYQSNLSELLVYNDERFREKINEINELDKNIKELIKKLTLKERKKISINKKNQLMLENLQNQNAIMAQEINKLKSSKYYKALIFKYNLTNKIKNLVKNNWQKMSKKTLKIKTSKTKLPLISVIIPVYNRKKELKESIESILNQTYPNLELILVTDGSPTETHTVINKYKKDQRVKIFHYFNQSGNAIRGRNKGIKEAQGEYIAFQDSDDIAEPNRLEISLYYMNKFKVDLVYGTWKALVDGSRKDVNIKNGQIITSPESNLQLMKKTCIPCQSTVMVKKSALVNVGGLNTKVKYHEDHELWLRLLHFGYKFKSIPEPLIQLRLHSGNNELNFKKDDEKWHKMALKSYLTKRKLPKKIAYLIPGTGIGGGIAVVCEHVNRLLKLGFDTLIITEGEIKNLNWFPNQAVNVVSINDKDQLENIDILIMTGWSTAYSGNSIKAKRKIYFVQSDERRFFPEDKNYIKQVNETYKMDYEYITEAKWIQKWLKSEFNKNASYVPNGVNTNIFYPTKPIEEKPKNKLRILLEGPIDIPFKGMNDAFAAVQNIDCEVWCISSAGKPKPEWHCDRFFEKVPMQDMRKIYSSCDILIKMSRVEGFFGPPLEMMACGGISIVAKVTGYDEYIKDKVNSLVVNPGDTKEISKILKNKLINRNSTLYKKLQKGGSYTYKIWTWEKSIKNLIKVIESDQYHNK